MLDSITEQVSMGTNVPEVLPIGLELPKAKRKRNGEHSKENVVSKEVDIPAVCTETDCSIQYKAVRITFKNGDVILSPTRCEDCQTAYLANLRVNKVLAGIKHLGNIKSRLSIPQRDAIVKAIHNELTVLLDVYAGTAISTGGFDITKI